MWSIKWKTERKDLVQTCYGLITKVNFFHIQVKQLLLDPAVQKEFERMKAELEKAAKEMKTLQEELQAVQFSQDSKAGRMLMAKCRALQVIVYVLSLDTTS